jgi:hypothetical protein
MMIEMLATYRLKDRTSRMLGRANKIRTALGGEPGTIYL